MAPFVVFLVTEHGPQLGLIPLEQRHAPALGLGVFDGHVDDLDRGVAVWGAAGGLGVFAVQLIKKMGAESVGVVNSDEKGELIMKLGAKGCINRKEFDCWGQLPKVGTPEYNAWLKEARKWSSRSGAVA